MSSKRTRAAWIPMGSSVQSRLGSSLMLVAKVTRAADAPLIAAAPDLRDALEALVWAAVAVEPELDYDADAARLNQAIAAAQHILRALAEVEA